MRAALSLQRIRPRRRQQGEVFQIGSVRHEQAWICGTEVVVPGAHREILMQDCADAALFALGYRLGVVLKGFAGKNLDCQQQLARFCEHRNNLPGRAQDDPCLAARRKHPQRI